VVVVVVAGRLAQAMLNGLAVVAAARVDTRTSPCLSCRKATQ